TMHNPAQDMWCSAPTKPTSTRTPARSKRMATSQSRAKSSVTLTVAPGADAPDCANPTISCCRCRAVGNGIGYRVPPPTTLSLQCFIGSMNIHELLQTLSDRIAASASIKNVYGEPVTVGNRTVIPVARVTLGFGGGAGEEKGAKEGHGGGGG